MNFPADVTVTVRFATGPVFIDTLILGSADDGILGVNVLGTNGAPTVDVTAQVNAISINRGKDRVLDTFNAGQATIEIIDFNGDWDPDNTAGPFYGELLPLIQIRVSAEWDRTRYWLFSGYVVQYHWRYETALAANIVTLVCEDGFRLLNLAQLELVAGADAGDTTAERFAQIMAAVDWPSSALDITPGGVTVQDDTGTLRPVLSMLQTIEATELGGCYFDAQGRLVFRTFDELAVIAAGTEVQFQQGLIPFEGLSIQLDDIDLANDVIVERDNGTPQQELDQDSIDRYFRRSVFRSGLIMESDAEADDQARRILNYRKTPARELEALTVQMVSPSPKFPPEQDRIARCLDLELFDPVVIRQTTPTGAFLEDHLIIQGISHRITPDDWTVQYRTARALATAFVLGNVLYGVLGQSTL